MDNKHLCVTCGQFPCMCAIPDEKDYAPEWKEESALFPHNSEVPAVKAEDAQVGGEHYKNLPYQPYLFAVQNNIGAYEWKAMEYVMRHAEKGGLEDLKKAIHTIQLLAAARYGEEI